MPEQKKEGQEDALDKDTKEILKEIKEGDEKPEEGNPPEKEAGEEPEKKPEKKEGEAGEGEGEGDDKPGEGEGDKGEGEEGKTFQRTPTMMPMWKYRVAEKKWDKDKGELEEKLRVASQEKESPEKEEKIAKMADEYGLDVKLIKEIVDLAQPTLPKDVLDRLGKLEQTSASTEEQQQSTEFENDFNKNVLPLIKAEYSDASEKLIDRIKSLVNTLAFTEDLISTPLSMIYKGSEQFRKVGGKKTAESSADGGGVESVSIDGIKPEDLENMSDAEFDKFSEAAEKGSKKFKLVSSK